MDRLCSVVVCVPQCHEWPAGVSVTGSCGGEHPDMHSSGVTLCGGRDDEGG